MEAYNVGTNAPIKLKIAIETEAIPMSYAFLYHTIDDKEFFSSIPPFDPTQKTGWKQLDGGNPVNGTILRVLTFLRFFNDFPDEKTFKLAIKQVEDTYEPSINGGDDGPYTIPFKLKAFYENKSCVLESGIKLI
ncbi:hypothetical protein [Gelidibacter maritimus]|uniref:Uncharacterized protein n=1 Tax=Gelidibacter maritimus TaxID=2761487 RepID=A0A7W2M4B8_9FLAO|nr:hypothetical protein [Gelidibacter maritimus]MBA6152464.1 hypothetical protein [Gelidibacter maritimus]